MVSKNPDLKDGFMVFFTILRENFTVINLNARWPKYTPPKILIPKFKICILIIMSESPINDKKINTPSPMAIPSIKYKSVCVLCVMELLKTPINAAPGDKTPKK